MRALRLIWRSVPAGVRRAAVLLGGGLLLIAGLLMLVLPGPGLLVIAAGVALLATEFAWARFLTTRAMRFVQRRRQRLAANRDRI
jgi:uncharacterized protein (TIGR02611 family)